MRPRYRWLVVAALAAVPSCGDGIAAPGGDTARLRVLHTLVSVPTVDVMVGGQVVLPALPFGVPSAFVDVPAGSQEVGFRPSGTNAAPLSSAVSFVANDSLTIFTIDSSSIINPWVLTDSGAVVPADKSKLRVAHFAAAATLIDIWRTQPDWQDFVTIMFPFRYLEATPYVQSDPGDWRTLVSSEVRQGGVPVLTDTLLLTDPIGIGAGESRTVIVLDRDGGGLQAAQVNRRCHRDGRGCTIGSLVVNNPLPPGAVT